MKLSASSCFALALVIFFVSGCKPSAECQGHTDCFLFEQCVANECVAAPEIGEDAGRDVTDDETLLDVSDEDVRRDAGEDVRDEDTGAADVALPDEVCIGDRFASCEDRGNESRNANSKWDASFPPREGTSAGCVLREGEFVAYDGVFEERLCHNEPADWFRFTLTGCENIEILGQFRIVLDQCPISMVETEVHLNNRKFNCEDEDFSCFVDEEGALVNRFSIPPNRTVMTLYLGIMSTEEQALFDYDLHYRIYR